MKPPVIEMVPLNEIRPNPWRDFARNPINTEKVEQIYESIATTGEFWIGVYGRRVSNGVVELAFGHNRFEAAKYEDTGDMIEAARAAGLKAIPVALRDFTDGEMLMRMTRENLRGELPVVLEAVSAVVRAYAEGKIEMPKLDPSTRKDVLRYAPSFVPGRPDTSEVPRPYTADTLAQTLGGMYIKKTSGKAQNSVVAALGILELEEKKVVGYNDRMYTGKSIREIIPMNSDIKHRTEVIAERRGKSQAELNELREKQLAAQKKAKEDEKAAEAAHKAYVQKLADAKRDENNRKADADAKAAKEADSRAKEKEALNKLRMAELDTQIKAKKEWEAEQCVQDQYLPIRRDVEAMIGKLETMVSERNPLREAVKALAVNKKIKPQDLVRLRAAAVAVADWYNDWVAPQFAPEMKAAQKAAVMNRKATQIRTERSGA